MRGFTLVEMVVVMLMVAILAVFAIPRLNIGGVFSARGFGDQVRSQIQYGQKLAVAQRRNVCVAVSASAITITKAPAAGAGVACSITPDDPVVALSAPSGVSISPVTTLYFDALGQSVDAGGTPLAGDVTLTVSGDVVTTVKVEKVTGYVR